MQDVSKRNRNYEPLTEKDDTLMQHVVAYYEKHGTSNELMEAYYLLGSVYRDLHEAPKAMETFIRGIDMADTTTGQCNYSVLTRLQAQKIELMSKQRLYEQSIEEREKLYHYAKMASDTLFMVDALWDRLLTYHIMHDDERVADECWNVLEESKRLGRWDYATGQLCFVVLANIEVGRLEDAHKLLQIYEQYSDDVNQNTHESSFPIYYYAKGRLLTQEHKMDSAEWFFRKELKERDWNNRQAAYRGLREVFEKTGRLDSAILYAALQCDAVDSAYQEMLSANLQNLREMYDYSRAQRDSYQKSMQLEREHAHVVYVRWALAFVAMIALLVLYYLYARFQQQVTRAELELEQAKYAQSETEYQLQELQRQMGVAENEEEKVLLEKEMQQTVAKADEQRRQVEDKQERLDELRRRVRSAQKDLRQRMYDNALFRHLLRKAKEKNVATEEDYAKIIAFLQRRDGEILERFAEVVPMASEAERKVFLLMRMGLTKAEVATLTSHEDNSVSMIINRLFKKIHQRGPENSAEADNWLLEI